jgi:glycosyltransferase involved in cell wall biosynthesis
MKLLFLCKRRPMGRDLLSSPYGRFYYLPKLLAERGHEVAVSLLDYERAADSFVEREGIPWSSRPVTRYVSGIRAQAAQLRPDWVIGFSDTYFGILADRTAKRVGAKACIDAYDNYESYMPWAKPLHWAWRRSLDRADLITAAGPGLLELMAARRTSPITAVVPMAADPVGFGPRDKVSCRRELGLPLDRPLVGYCGSVHRSRGVGVLFDAIPLVRTANPDVLFVHSGRTWKDVPLPTSFHSLGYIDADKMPILLNSMDVLVVVNRPSSFGHHSYPVKLYEAMSCGVPVVATQTTATAWILEGQPDALVSPDDPEELSSAIQTMLRVREVDYGPLPTWSSSCDMLEEALMAEAR